MKSILFLLITQILTQGCGEPNPCTDNNCCLCRQIPNLSNGNGFQEFNANCQTNAGEINCVTSSGCQLCYKPTFGLQNVGNRPICQRFANVKPTCSDDQCCFANQNPNLSDGNGFMEFSATCLANGGGLNCVSDSGCQLCYKPVEVYDGNGGLHLTISNVGNRPICARFANIINAAKVVTRYPNCDDNQCCVDAQTPNEDNGNGFYEFNSDCKTNGGGLHCVADSGCRLCYKPVLGGVNVGDRPTCERFLNLWPNCTNDECCFDLQNANQNDGNGFLEFNSDCLANGGGLHCVAASGCRLCYKPVLGSTNVGDRPVCDRFATVHADNSDL